MRRNSIANELKIMNARAREEYIIIHEAKGTPGVLAENDKVSRRNEFQYFGLVFDSKRHLPQKDFQVKIT